MAKLSQTITDGLASARNGGRNLERALKGEWRAIRIAEQDRAHLATVAYAPSLGRQDPYPTVAALRSIGPPMR